MLLLPGAADAQSASSFWRSSLGASEDYAVAGSRSDRLSVNLSDRSATSGDGFVSSDVLSLPAPDRTTSLDALPTDRPRRTPNAVRDSERRLPQAADPPPRAVSADVDPYAAPGLRLGTIRVLPSVAVLGGWERGSDSRSSGDDSAVFTDVEPALRLETDWDRHAVTLDAAARSRVGDDLTFDENYGYDARLRGRLDMGASALGSDTVLTLDLAATEESGETLRTALPGSRLVESAITGGVIGDVTPVGAGIDDDGERTLFAALGIGHRLGRADLGLDAEWERTDREVGNDATTGRLRGRVGLDASQVSPFLETSVARTRFCTGCGGDFDAVGALAGLRLRDDRRLSGEVALGYELRRYDEAGTETGLVWRGSLDYEVTPLITLDLVTEATLGDAADNASRSVAIGLTHLPRRWLTLSGGLAVTWEDYETLIDGQASASDMRTLTATLGAEYRLSRYAALTADATHERRDATGGDDPVVNTVRIGVILRR